MRIVQSPGRRKFGRVVSKSLIQLVIIAIAFIPTWVFLGLRSMVNPEGFWQNLALTGVGIWIGGGLQFMFIIFLVATSISLWSDP